LKIVSRKDKTNLIKLSPMNTSRGRNEEHSKKMGQFDRIAFKQSGESLFDGLFEFDRQLKDTMAYANTQKNGSLDERVKINTLEMEMFNSLDSLKKNEGLGSPAIINPPQNTMGEQIQFNITDDVDDEAIYGKRRQRHKPLGR
jgi:hypothetical protein